RKTRVLIAAVEPAVYVAIDISAEQLRSAVASLSADFTQVRMYAVCADYTQAVPLDDLEALRGPRRIIYFPGSTIGNFNTADAHRFLVNARQVARNGGAMAVGGDMQKGVAALE